MVLLILVRTEASSGELEQNWGFLKRIKRVTKSPTRLQGNGLKLKNTVPGATSPGHTWSLSPGLLASRLPCHSTPKQQTLEPTANGGSSRAGVPHLPDRMPDDLRGTWRNNKGNKVHSKCKAPELSRNHPSLPPPSVEKVIFHQKPAFGAKKVEGHCSKGSMILCVCPSGFQVEGKDIRLVSSSHMPGPKLIPPQGTRIWLWGLSYWRWALPSLMGSVPARREGPSTCQPHPQVWQLTCTLTHWEAIY